MSVVIVGGEEGGWMAGVRQVTEGWSAIFGFASEEWQWRSKSCVLIVFVHGFFVVFDTKVCMFCRTSPPPLPLARLRNMHGCHLW